MASSSDSNAQKPVRKFELLDIHPLELAQQLALMEHDLCRNVQQSDIEARRGNLRSDSDSVAPPLRFSNDLASWVAGSVLEHEDTPRRAAVIEHFIAIAHTSRGMNNLSSLNATIAALKSPPIRRLTETWKLVTKESTLLLTSCALTCHSAYNFSTFWTVLACLEPPGVPFLGHFVSLHALDDDYSDGLMSRGYVRWQSTPYQFEVDEDLQAFIKDGLSKMGDGTEERFDRFFAKLSLEREPGKRGEGAVSELLRSPFRWFQRLQ